MKFIENLSKEKGLKVVSLPYLRAKEEWFDSIVSAGPIEFLRYIKDATYVCTDSFHGTAFSLNFGTPFFTFEREYGSAGKQSSRVTSLLELVGLLSRFNPSEEIVEEIIDFSVCENVLEKERTCAMEYLACSLQEVKDLYEK